MKSHDMLVFRLLFVAALGLWMGNAQAGMNQPSPVPLNAESDDPGRGEDDIDLGEVERLLAGEGVVGWIHGVMHDARLYVFTYRDPNNFFRFAQFPMIASSRALGDRFRDLGRHDKVRLFGRFVDNEAPIKHVLVSEFVIEEAYDRGDHYDHVTQIPDDLVGRNELTGKVHAVGNNGAVFVIEYGDVVLPVFVPEPELTQDLYRNDKIKMKYIIRTFPSRPPHLELAVEEEEPLVVFDRMVDWHGDEVVMEGSLVMFPESPQIIFDVYALQQVDESGIKRNFTLVNFEDQEAFEQIRAKLSDVWVAHAEAAIPGRNKFVNPTIQVKATGTVNVVAPNQANPQILLESAEDLTFTIVD